MNYPIILYILDIILFVVSAYLYFGVYENTLQKKDCNKEKNDAIKNNVSQLTVTQIEDKCLNDNDTIEKKNNYNILIFILSIICLIFGCLFALIIIVDLIKQYSENNNNNKKNKIIF